MLSFESDKSVRFCDGMRRRDFLKVGGLSAGSVSLSLSERAHAAPNPGDINCIVLFLVGGPSHLDTWDPKPGAPSNVRGPFRPIPTNVPGVQVAETFPLMAKLADRYAIVRSVNHASAPIHETGHQLMQTGQLLRGGIEHPHYGAVVSQLRGERRSGVPPFVVVPTPIGNTGIDVGHGQSGGYLGERHGPCYLHGERGPNGLRIHHIRTSAAVDPGRVANRRELLDAVDDAERTLDAAAAGPAVRADAGLGRIFSPQARRAYDLSREPAELRARYGENTFGQSCLLARRLVEYGVGLVTVNMFDTVFGKLTWDCHADGNSLATTLEDYRQTLCPMFDRAYASLLEDLGQRGLLERTLVVAMGEFGRTPHLNASGGRDHWPGAWSVLFAGAGVRGGQVIGSTDAIGAEPRDRPVSPAEIAASVYRALRIDGSVRLPGAAGPLCSAVAVQELFV